MKKTVIIVIALILVLSVAISVILFNNSSKIVLKCEYNTNLTTKNGEFYNLGYDENLFFINISNKTINDRDWKEQAGYNVVIDKNFIDFDKDFNITYHIDRKTGEFSMVDQSKQDKLYISTGECKKYNYRQKF